VASQTKVEASNGSQQYCSVQMYRIVGNFTGAKFSEFLFFALAETRQLTKLSRVTLLKLGLQVEKFEKH